MRISVFDGVDRGLISLSRWPGRRLFGIVRQTFGEPGLLPPLFRPPIAADADCHPRPQLESCLCATTTSVQPQTETTMPENHSLPDDGFAHADASSCGRCPLMPMTDSSPLSDLLRLMGCGHDLTPDEAAISIPKWQVRSGAALLLEGARASHLYIVRTGTFKCIKTAEDGYEQVLAFAGQGDVIAFEAICGEAQRMGAVALENSIVYALPVREIFSWRRLSPQFDHVLQVALSHQLIRAGQMTELMSAVSSDVRLARFIVWWSSRMVERGQSPRRLLLRMSRREIASLLGVAHETVSRSFSSFVDQGLLRVENRQIEILDPAGLMARTRNTRGLSDDAPDPAAAASNSSGPVPRARRAESAVGATH